MKSKFVINPDVTSLGGISDSELFVFFLWSEVVDGGEYMNQTLDLKCFFFFSFFIMF